MTPRERLTDEVMQAVLIAHIEAGTAAIDDNGSHGDADRAGYEAMRSVILAALGRTEEPPQTSHVYVGGYEIDPRNPTTCQICGKHPDQHAAPAPPTSERPTWDLWLESSGGKLRRLRMGYPCASAAAAARSEIERLTNHKGNILILSNDLSISVKSHDANA